MPTEKSTLFIDWLSYVVEDTVIMHDAHAQEWFSRLGLSADGMKQCRPTNAYRKAWRNDQGAILQSTANRLDMGINVLLTGSVLKNYDWKSVLEHCFRYYGHVARVDLTIDARDYGLSIEKCHKLIMGKKAITKARNATLVQSKTGTTCYVGSRSSDRFLRIYDKAGEQGIENADWKRIELELAGDKATWACEQILQAGPQYIPGIIRAFIDFDGYAPWMKIMGQAVPADVDSMKHTTDTQKWLLETVAKSLAKQLELDPSFEFEFQEAVTAFRSLLQPVKVGAKLNLQVQLSKG